MFTLIILLSPETYYTEITYLSPPNAQSQACHFDPGSCSPTEETLKLLIMSLNKLSSKSQIRLYYQRWIPNVIIAHFISCLCFINSYDYDTLLIRLILLKHTSPYLSSKYNPLSFQNSKYYLSRYFTPKLRLLLGKTLQESKVNYDQFNNLIKLF